MLKSDGRLILTNLTPVISTIWHKFAYWDQDQHQRGMKEGEVYGLSRSDIERMLSQAGFAIAEKRRFSWGLNTIYRCKKSATHEQMAS